MFLMVSLQLHGLAVRVSPTSTLPCFIVFVLSDLAAFELLITELKTTNLPVWALGETIGLHWSLWFVICLQSKESSVCLYSALFNIQSG